MQLERETRTNIREKKEKKTTTRTKNYINLCGKKV
jgi:hypothetical protein